MVDVLPDILRSGITNLMFLLLLLVLARPRYPLWTIVVSSVFVDAANVLLNLGSYLQGNHTTPVYVGAFIMIPWLIAMKPLIEDSFMQWCFDVVTASNVLVIVVFLSYRLAILTPFPEYMDVVMVVILFSTAIIVLQRFLKPLYLQVLEHWNSYFLATLGLLSCFVYEYGFTGGIESAMQRNAPLLTLLSLATVFVYLAIFLSLRSISRTYELREVAMHAESRKEALKAELEAERTYVDAARRSRHDQRHHDTVVLEYLDDGNVDKAIEYLHGAEERITSGVLERFCENAIANAVLRMTARHCHEVGVVFSCSAQIPECIVLTPNETGELFGNLLENACEACAVDATCKARIDIRAEVSDGSLCIEECNTVMRITDFADGMPLSSKVSSGGIGTRSMRDIVEHVGGMIRFSITGEEFKVQIVLPLL